MEYKQYKLQIKEFSEDGNGGFRGYLSVFGNVDRGGDIVMSGAFTKTLRENVAFPLYWAHQTQNHEALIGSFSGKQDGHGLMIEAEFLPDPASQAIREKVRILKSKGVKVGLSIGYETIESSGGEIDGEGVRYLKEIKLYEGSLTLFPMNEEALVQAVKDGLESPAQAHDKTISFICGECGRKVLEITDPVDEKALEAMTPEDSTSALEPPDLSENMAVKAYLASLASSIEGLKKTN